MKHGGKRKNQYGRKPIERYRRVQRAFMLPPHTVRKLERLAQLHGVSRSEIVTRLIRGVRDDDPMLKRHRPQL